MGDILNFLSEAPAEDQTRPDLPSEKGIVDFLAQPDPLPGAVEKGLVTPPDQAANIIRLQAKTGLPQGVIERNIDYVEAESNKQGFNATEFRKNNPKLADWLAQDKNRVALANTDIEGMSAMETAFSTLKSIPYGFKQGMEKQYLMSELTWEKVIGGPDQNEELRQQMKAGQGKEFQEGLPSWTRAAADILGMNFQSILMAAKKEGTIGLGGGAAAGAALGLIGGPGAPVTATAGAAIFGTTGFSVGMTTGYMSNLYKMSVADVYSELEDERDEQGNPIDPTVVKYASLVVGLPNAALETLALGKAIKLIPGADKVVGAITKNQMKQLLLKPTVREALKDFGKKYAVAVTSETVTEGMQKFLNIITRETAQEISGQTFKPYDEKQKRQDIEAVLAESTEAFKGMVVLGALGAGPKSIETYNDIKKSQQNEQFIRALGENLNGSTILSKSPEAVKSYVEHLKKDGDIQNVYIPVEAWDKLFQMDSAKAAREILGNDQYAEARAVNGDIVIPLEVYAEKLAGTSFHDQLMPDITFKPGEMSARAAADATKNFSKDVEAEAKTIEDSYKANDPVRKVYNDVYGQHIAIGTTRQEAERIATLVSQRQAAWADLLGKDAYELWQEKPIGFQREMPAVLRNKEVDINLDPLLDQLRSGKGASQKEIFGSSLTEFLKEKGGLLDQGTELSTMDVDVERKRSAKKLVQKEGMTLDNAAELAAEQGYIDEADISKLLDAIDRETRGDPVYVPGKENQDLLNRDKELNDLNDYLNSIGADIKTMDNAAVRKLVKERESGPTEMTLYSGNIAVYNVSHEPLYQKDLLGDEVPDQGTKQPRAAKARVVQSAVAVRALETEDNAPGVYAVETALVSEYSRQIHAETINTPQEAAQALAFLSDYAVEHFDALITDKNGKPLAVVGAFKGALSQTSVYPSTVVSEAVRVKGAANIWFGHNHPSGLSTLSDADRRLMHAMTDAFNHTKIQPRGIFAVAGSGDSRSFTHELHNGDRSVGEVTRPSGKGAMIPVVERIYTKDERMGTAINSPSAARTAIPAIAKDQAGIVLLDTQHRPVAFIARESMQLDEAMLRAISKSNAAAAMVANANKTYTIESLNNLKQQLNIHDVRLLDAFDYTIKGDEVTDIKSHAEMGTMQEQALYQTDAMYIPSLRAVQKENKASMFMLRRIYPQLSTIKAQSLLEKMVEDGYITPKSQVEGTFDVTEKLRNFSKEDLLYQTAPSLYSQLRVAILDMNDKIFQGSAQNVKLHLMNNLGKYGIKRDELFWTGLEEFLSMDKKVSKADVLSFLDENAVVTKDVVLGDDIEPVHLTQKENDEYSKLDGMDERGILPDNLRDRYQELHARVSSALSTSERNYKKDTQFPTQVLHGGRDYRELLITLPTESDAAAKLRDLQRQMDALRNGRLPEKMTAEENAQFDALLSKYERLDKQRKSTFTSSHYPDAKNLIAHVRLNTRDDAQGRVGTFAEEFQSDWSIAASKNGFALGAEERAAQQNKAEELRNKIDRLVAEKGMNAKEDADRMTAELSALHSKIGASTPPAPFVTSATGKGSTAHTMLSMKKTILYAIEQGHEFISWTTGSQQKDRYSLSKQIESVTAQREADGTYNVNAMPKGKRNASDMIRQDGIAESGLEDVIGKDLAKKIIADTKDSSKWVSYKGLELDIGGEWADALYGDENGLDANGKPSLMSQAVKEVARQLGIELKVEAIEVSETSKESKQTYIGEQKSIGDVNSALNKLSTADADYHPVSQILKAMHDGDSFSDAITEHGDRDTAQLFGGKFEYRFDKNNSLQPGFTITSALRSKVTSAGMPLFQKESTKGFPEDALGMYSRESHIITYFKRANPSTGLHELGHAWLEEMRIYAQREDAPQKLLDMWATVQKEYGITEDKIPVEAHEKFARSFETYVMTGKSPSVELNSVFTNFKNWLLKIYKSIAPGDVSPAMREIFDRMLATDEQIALAREIQGYARPFLNEEGMTKVEYEAYQKINDKAKAEAEDATRAKVMGELLREQSAWWKKARAVMREEVVTEIDATPSYRALSWLRKGVFPDGSVIEGIEPMRLSKDALVQRYGEPFLKSLPKPYIYQIEGGLHPDVAAEYLGFDTGEELVKALAEAKPRGELIDAETDQRMKAKYGDMMIDGTIADEADFQVNNDRQAEVFMYEMKVLKRRGSTHNISPKEVFQQIARSVIQDKKVGDLDPKYYEHAARKAGQEAEKALLGKDMKMGVARNLDLAFEAKQRQLLNLYLFKEAFLAKTKIEKAQDSFLDMFKKDEKLAKTRNMDMVNAARAISAQHGIGGTEQNAMAYLEQMREYDPQTYDDMKMVVDLAISDSKPFKQLTVAEFGLVQDSIDGLWELSRLSQQITIEGKKVLISNAIDELRPRLHDLAKGKDIAGYKKAITENEKAGQWLLGQRAKFSMMEWWVDYMDGGNFDGSFRKILQTEARKGLDEYRVKRKEVREKMIAILQEHGERFTTDKIYSSDLDYTFGAGETKGRLAKEFIFGSKERGRIKTAGEFLFSSTGSGRAELLGAISHIGNQSNFERLLRGRHWGEFNEDGTLDTTRWDAAIKKMWDNGTLTQADYDVMQKIWNLNEEIKPAAQKAFKEMYGYYFEEITAREFNTPFGTYKGGYVPAIYDTFMSDDAAAREDRAALENQSLGTIMPTPAKGFTKQRKSRYSAPLKLDIRALPMHMDKVLMLTYIAPRVREVSRLVMNKKFKSEMNLVDPTIISEMIIPWLDRTVKQSVEVPSTSKIGRMNDKFFREIRTRTGMQLMSLHVVNAMQQVTGLSPAAVKLKHPGRMKESLVRYMKHPQQTAEEISKLSKFMHELSTTQMVELNKRMDNILLNPTKYDRAADFAKEHGYFMQVATQNAVNNIVWDAAYNEAIEENPNKERAVEYANSRIRMTQGTFYPEDISRFEANSAFVRMFTMLYRYFNTQLNLNYYEQKLSLERGGFNGAKRGLFVHTLGFMIPSVVGTFIWQAMSGADFDPDDDGYLDDFLKLFFFGQIQYATAMIPFAGPVAQMGINEFNDKWYDDRISVSPAVSSFEATARAPFSIYNAVVEDGSHKRAIQDSLTAVGVATGLPLKPLGKPLGYLADIEQGKAEPTGPIDLTRGLITGKSQ